MRTPILSIVIPLYNEEENIPLLLQAIREALHRVHHEVILVDDGSSDGTLNAIYQCGSPKVKLVELRRNYGQTAALKADIAHALGLYILAMDGDLQNDPRDIPQLLIKIMSERWDMVTGRRVHRKDSYWHRTLPSQMANWIIRKTSGILIQDTGCIPRIMEADLARALELLGDLHRFIHFLASLQGARIADVDVHLAPRQYGKSRYGWERMTKVVSDLLLLLFLKKYKGKTMYFFGTLGPLMILAGSLSWLYLFMFKLSGFDIGQRQFV